ncbi:hypothetical protein RISK_004545 [Rhodopirellula islandica]|uniref:Uncharacterized protein n=1 Tax=Rhodopirellula islandica TaxID=595434 RepID=A0A0J1B9L3_RHOIS|nr:hypothetical protein RISK_004545 [Rhodopirellula islandica]
MAGDRSLLMAGTILLSLFVDSKTKVDLQHHLVARKLRLQRSMPLQFNGPFGGHRTPEITSIRTNRLPKNT